MSGWLFLGVVTLICAMDFIIGLRFVRAEDPPVGAPPDGPSAAQRRKVGWMFLIFAPVLWLITASIALGLFGPVPGIEPILTQAGE